MRRDPPVRATCAHEPVVVVKDRKTTVAVSVTCQCAKCGEYVEFPATSETTAGGVVLPFKRKDEA